MKKTISLILSIIMILGTVTLPTFAAAECIGWEYGEKYGEDGFDISYYKYDDEEQFAAGDINADNKLNAVDSRMLSSLIVGK